MKQRVLVIFGGRSTEHDISIISGLQVYENLDREMFEPVIVYIDSEGKWWSGEGLKRIDTYKNFSSKKLTEVAILPCSKKLFKRRFNGFIPLFDVDCAFIVMHGMNGEDGTLQGLLELSQIPYTSSGVLSSSVGMDKVMMKRVFNDLGLPILPYFEISRFQYEKMSSAYKLEKIAFPVIVKPAKLGSSIGITICKKQKDLTRALELAFKFDDCVVVERAVIKLKEVNISVLGFQDDIELSVIEQPVTSNLFLTFQDKYCKKSKTRGMENLTRKIPADIDDDMKTKLQEYAKIAFRGLNCKGVVRIDFIIDEEEKELYINEINTIPGSLSFYLWDKKQIDFRLLLTKLYQIAIRDSEERKKQIFVFQSSVLNGLGGSKGKKANKL